MEYIETVKWRIYNYDKEAYARVSKTHVFDAANKTLCGLEIPNDAIFQSHLSQPITCKRCLAKHEAA